MVNILILLLCCWSCHAKAQENSTTRNIYLLTLLPYPNPDPAFSPSWEEGDNIRPALELAKDQINRNTLLLQNYTLHLIHASEGCQDTTTTAVSFVKEAFQPDRNAVTGIIGPGCSISTTELGKVTNRSELSLVHVHGSGSPTLANHTLFQYMLGTLGSSDNLVKGFLYLASEAAWNRVAVLYDDSQLHFFSTNRYLIAKINATFLSPVSSTLIPLSSILDLRLRVIFIHCPVELSRQIICLAYHSNMTYDQYQWVIAGHQQEDLLLPVEFFYETAEYKCSAEDMVSALEKALLITYRLTPSDDSALISNTTYEDYLTSYTQYREDYNLQPPRFSGQRNSSYTHWATYLYDAVWAWALVLDNLTKSGGFEIGSEYGNKEQAEMIVEQFYQTKFSGMSGEISFNKSTGYAIRDINIFQISEGNSTLIAILGNKNNSRMAFAHIPDTFPITFRERKAAGVIFTVILVIEVSVIAVLQVLTVAYCRRPSIKATSPKLLHLSYVGIYIIAMGTFVWVLNAAAEFDVQLRPYFCQLLWAWSIPVGFILSFVPVAMRTWRIYRIFKHYLNPGPLISDPVLIGGTLLATLGILTIGVAWTVHDPFVLTQRFTFGRSVQVVPMCISMDHFYWVTAVLVYLVLILLVVSTFALLTRNIANQSFTTNSLRALCYVMVAIFLVGIPLYFILAFSELNPVYDFSVLAVLISVMLLAFIICIFAPPLLPIFKSYRQNIFFVKVTMSPPKEDQSVQNYAS